MDVFHFLDLSWQKWLNLGKCLSAQCLRTLKWKWLHVFADDSSVFPQQSYRTVWCAPLPLSFIYCPNWTAHEYISSSKPLEMHLLLDLKTPEIHSVGAAGAFLITCYFKLTPWSCKLLIITDRDHRVAPGEGGDGLHVNVAWIRILQFLLEQNRNMSCDILPWSNQGKGKPWGI